MTRPTAFSRSLACLLPCMGALALAACQNESTTLVHAGPAPLPDLQPAPDQQPLPTPANPPKPSLTGLSRSNWDAVEVVQPRGQVETATVPVPRWDGFSTEPRAAGAYPNLLTVLHTSQRPDADVASGASAPFVAAFWIVAWPVTAVAQYPWNNQRAPGAGVEWVPPPPPPNAMDVH